MKTKIFFILCLTILLLATSETANAVEIGISCVIPVIAGVNDHNNSLWKEAGEEKVKEKTEEEKKYDHNEIVVVEETLHYGKPVILKTVVAK